MKITQFCLLLQVSYSCEFIYQDADKEIFTFKPAPEEDLFERNILYISASPRQLPNPSEKGFDLLVYGPDAPQRLSDLRKRYPRANILCARQQEGETVSGLYGVVSDIFLAENRFTAQINHMARISSSNLGMQRVIEEASRILEAPIVVIDTSYRVLATSYGQRADNEGDLEEQRRLGALTANNLRRLKRDQVFEAMRRNPDRLSYSKAKDAHHWWLNMLIYVHGMEVAEVGVMEDKRKFSDHDFEFIKYLRYVISLEIQRGNSFGKNYSLSHNLLVADLLDTSAMVAEVAIRHRSSLLGWPKSPYYSVLAIFPNTTGEILPGKFFQKGEILASQVARHLPRCYWRVGQRDLAFLIPHDQWYWEDPEDAASLLDMLRANQMIAILSNPVDSLMEVREGYEQTIALYHLRESLPGDGPLFRYSDHTILHITSILYKSHALKSFFHPYVRMVQDYDEEHHTDFLKTLYQYLTFIDNPTVIAKNLHIHKNTLYYRINKLKELFPIDLNNGHIRLGLQLTMEMLGKQFQD